MHDVKRTVPPADPTPADPSSEHRALFFGVCIGLGWEGVGQVPRGIRREAQRRLDTISEREQKRQAAQARVNALVQETP